jgi:hypothetical protein
MAATITKTNDYGRVPSAPSFIDTFTVVPDTSYPSGGYLMGLVALLPKGVTIAKVDAGIVVTSTGALDPGFRAAYNVATDKVQIFTIGTSPVEASGNLSTDTVTVTVFSY